MSADIGSIGDLGGEREKSIFIMQFFMESCAEGGESVLGFSGRR